MAQTLPNTLHLDAAAMLARDVPVTEVARQFGVSRRTIQTWAKTAEAQAQIAAVKSSVREATKHLAVADKVRRIQNAQRMLDGVLAVIEARRLAGLAATNPLPGETTGHVAVKTETLSNFVTKREAAFDASLHAAALKWQEYVAKELGEFETGVTVRHSGRVDHVISRPDLSVLSDEELESLLPLAEKVAAGEVDR
jgi:transposase-like protein